MSKVHITLVGGQPAPVYHGIVATQPDYILYVCSGSVDSKRALKELKKVLVHIPCECYFLDPTDPLLIKEYVESLVERFKDDDVTVNISGGLKSWTFWFSVVFDKQPNASVVYMDQNNVLWNYRTMQSSSDFEFDMHKLFCLHRNPLENYTPFSEYDQDDIAAIDDIEACRMSNFNDFNKLTTVLSKESRDYVKSTVEGMLTLPSSLSYVRWNKNREGGKPEVEICIYKDEQPVAKKLIRCSHAMDLVFSAGWFECKVANLLSKWEHAKDIYMNCHFPFKEGVDKNEVDIIINTGTKILFVECKTQIFDTTAIDKFRSVIKGYGGTASKGLFVTDARMNDVAKEKCREQGILIYSLKHFPAGTAHEETLAALLNKELYNINAR